ncbi:hypothetical protein RS030_2226 [Cryptosporidium xiaoi]|uniref:Uncharacterized protein n=1 Tax=Cryptosporidium xiaoi TaxID=659607 RepID=A0AAV9XVJ3_9CRYT
MEEIQVALFKVRSLSETILIDSSSQTDVSYLQSKKTPSEYVNYINYYIKEYELIKHSNSRSRQINTFITENPSHLKSHIRRYGEITNPSSGNDKNYQTHSNYFKELNIGYFLSTPNNTDSEPHFCQIPLNYKYVVDKSALNENYITSQQLLLVDEHSEVRHSFNCKCLSCNLPYPKSKNYLLKSWHPLPSKVPRYNFVSNGISEAIAMILMVGVNTIVEIIASIAISFCPKFPEKDVSFPSTGCILMDYFNDKIDFFINNTCILENSELEDNNSEGYHYSEDEINWNKKIDKTIIPFENKSLTVHNVFKDILNNCHQENENAFDPVKYLEGTPFSSPPQTHGQCPLREGFPNN